MSGPERAARIVLGASTASFRRMDFSVKFQLTYPVMPPSTAWGLLLAMCPDLPEEGVRASLHLSHQGVFNDFEHTHMIGASVEKLSPLTRECLGFPELELVIPETDGWSAEDFIDIAYFPQFPLSLGRSQDLAAVKEAQVVELSAESGTLRSGALLPWAQGVALRGTRGLSLPSRVDPHNRTYVGFDRYRLAQEELRPGEHAVPRSYGLGGLQVAAPLLSLGLRP